ncbi:MAG: translation elongation factor Ts [Caulobacterales bacterium]|nr:translation elongation factor Ts [Caulobacterales bacterium]
MAEITAARVKELREKTGAGMMDSKKALVETGGDFEAAVDWLRKKGLSKAAKKAGRVAADGLVGLAVSKSGGGATGAVVEVNSETDFVARNETFQAFVREAAALAVKAEGDLDTLADTPVKKGGPALKDALTDLIATIGENMTVRRTASIAATPGVVADYVHGAAGDGIGRIGVLVGLKSEGDADKLAELGRKVAMHVAAAAPLAARVDELDPDVVARERAVLSEQARASGKPENVIEKMVEGRLSKFYGETVLLKQPFVMDNKTPVEPVLKEAEGEVGAPIELVGFLRYALGEGVEKKTEDFAAEVAAAAGQA